jgi:acetoin utilization deacetylase AcuC-like enzyme
MCQFFIDSFEAYVFRSLRELLTKLNPAVAVIPPLGHHAGHDEAKGFCQFNIVSTFLLNEKDVKKIF